MGCVLPGADDVAAFWKLLEKGESQIAPLPQERWNQAVHYSSDRDQADKTYSRHAAWVDENRLKRMAELLGLDPDCHNRQMIMAVEAGRQALKPFADADPLAWKTDILMGCVSVDDAMHLRLSYPDVRLTIEKLEQQQPAGWRQAIEAIERYFEDHTRSGIPFANAVLANAVVHTMRRYFGLRGEGAMVDAACASSLATIDMALERLRNHASDLIIAGGVESGLDMVNFVMFSKVGALAEESCLPFDHETSGLIQGEGAVVFVLQRLADAVTQGRDILGVITGCGAASDGQSASLFSPSQKGQVLAFERAYEQAGSKRPDYIECHGTGTQVGDAVELASLRSYFGSEPVTVGSVKALIGHTKGASGGAGLLKALLCIKQRTIPPSAYFRQPLNPDGNTRINTEPLSLSDSPGLRIGVSAFGLGNINYHLVVDEYVPRRFEAIERGALPVPPVALLGGIEVSGIDIGEYLANGNLHIPPKSIPQTDRRQLLAVIATREILNQCGVLLDRIDRKRVSVFAASTICLPAAVYMGIRLNYNDLIRQVADSSVAVKELLARCRDRFPAITEDSGPGILNNIIAARVCNSFDFQGKNLNIDADTMSLPMAMEMARLELRDRADLAIVVASEDILDEANATVRRGRFYCWLLANRSFAEKQAYPIQEIINQAEFSNDRP